MPLSRNDVTLRPGFVNLIKVASATAADEFMFQPTYSDLIDTTAIIMIDGK